MYKHLKAIIAQHPRHQHALSQCLNQSSDPMTLASLVGEKCRELRITDFRNPWSGFDDDLAAKWNEGFGLQAQEVATRKAAAKVEEDAAAPEPEPEPVVAAAPAFDWNKSTKKQIEQYVIDVTGVNLDTDMKKVDLIAAGKAAISAATVAAV